MKASVGGKSIKYSFQKSTGVFIIVLAALSVIFAFLPFFQIATLLGSTILLAGITYGLHTLLTINVRDRTPKLILGGFYIFVGSYLLLFNSAGILPFTFILMIFLLADSLLKMFLATKRRPFKGTGWAINAGIVNILLAFFIAAGYPSSAGWAIGFLIGVNLFFFGMINIKCTVHRVVTA